MDTYTSIAKQKLLARYREIRHMLTMDLKDGETPFGLTPEEEKFGPEDWAWQFLRLSTSYRNDYAVTKEQGLLRNMNARYLLPCVTAKLDEAQEKRPGLIITPRQLIDRERYCRKQFGLSTWLDPEKNKLLPKTHDNLFWFFPLSKVEYKPVADRKRFFEQIFYYDKKPPYLFASPPDISKERSPEIWFLIDCTRPVASQLESVRIICEKYRNDLRNFLGTISTPEFRNKVLNYTASAVPLAKGEYIPKEFSRIIAVNVLKGLKEQLKLYSATLTQEHKAILSKNNNLSCLLPVRDEKHFRTKKIQSGTITLSDGNPYKQMLVLQQLDSLDITPADVCYLITQSPGYKKPIGTHQYQSEWQSNLPERLDNSLNRAKFYVKEGYRWFVYAQYPKRHQK